MGRGRPKKQARDKHIKPQFRGRISQHAIETLEFYGLCQGMSASAFLEHIIQLHRSEYGCDGSKLEAPNSWYDHQNPAYYNAQGKFVGDPFEHLNNNDDEDEALPHAHVTRPTPVVKKPTANVAPSAHVARTSKRVNDSWERDSTGREYRIVNGELEYRPRSFELPEALPPEDSGSDDWKLRLEALRSKSVKGGR